MSDILKKIKDSKKDLFVGMAGPGTGKTTTFKTIIESKEYKRKNILILSFINKLIDDLSEDFKDFKNVKVSTLHSFAMQEMKKKIGDIDLDPDLDNVISEDYCFLNGKAINYSEKFYENNLTKKEEEFYKIRKDFYKYEKNLYSFNSIIYAFNKLFEKKESKIPKYDLILIDEFQDFNTGEYELIKLLNKKSKVILVGDDNQSLYYFKNAKPEQIKSLYDDISTEEFSLDYCYRCTEVIVDATKNLIENAKKSGFLEGRSDKNFLYPKGRKEKDELSLKYNKIDFIPSISGDLLIYQLEKNIKNYIKNNGKKRILILVPDYYKQTTYEGLIGKGFNVVEFELFSNEKCNKIKHKNLIEVFEILSKRKTDDLALRKIIFLYLEKDEIKKLLQNNKKIWYCLNDETKEKIEKDIEIFKKVKKGEKKLDDEEIKRLNEIFNLKKVLSKLVKGFKPIVKNSIEVEMTTVMSSKGLSADVVYYVGIDDREMINKETKKMSNHEICQFLVGITRAKEKLTLISLKDDNPKILKFINGKYINKIKNVEI